MGGSEGARERAREQGRMVSIKEALIGRGRRGAEAPRASFLIGISRGGVGKRGQHRRAELRRRSSSSCAHPPTVTGTMGEPPSGGSDSLRSHQNAS